MGYLNEMWISVVQRLFRAKHKSGIKRCPSRIVFEKMEFEAPQNKGFWPFLDNRGHYTRSLEP